MFDVFFLGENTELLEKIPFAKKIDSVEDVKSKTKMFWLVDTDVEVLDYGVFDFKPDIYDYEYEHVWKWDPANYGGVSLLPKRKNQGTKEINTVVCKKKFQVIRQTDPGDFFDKNPHSNHVWCVDPEYVLSDDIDWAPSNFEPNYIHSFHLRGQLEHKYPDKEGGVKLYPRNWQDADMKYHVFLNTDVSYPVLYVSDPDDYSARDKFDEQYVWLIDSDHKINPNTLDWVPNPFENTMIHSFRMPYQLQEKYPMKLGGIRLVPKNWSDAELKIHPDCPVEDEAYDVFYVDEDDFNADIYTELADRTKTEWFWAVDREYEFNGKLFYVPASHEQDAIHVFKIKGQLTERYPDEITEPWDTRCGGIRLINKNFDMTKHKYQDSVVPVKYDIFYTDNLVTNFQTFARKSRTKMFWLIDSEYQLDNNFKVVVPKHEQKFILNYQHEQLQHRYPENAGGIYLIPKDFDHRSQTKYKGPLDSSDRKYPILRVSDVDNFTDITEDCWVIDEGYQIDDDKLAWAPNVFERHSIHTFHLANQLEHKYPEAMGGVRWVPLEWDGNYVIHQNLNNVERRYPVTFVADPSVPPEKDEPQWLVDELYRVTDEINWLPDSFDNDKVHVFHVKDQLTSKYTESMGGVYWWPGNNTDAELKIHSEPLNLSVVTYPVVQVTDPGDYSEVTSACWLVDSDYEIEKVISVIPWQNSAEKDMLHTFHVAGQLEHKYPEAIGGVRWVPENWQDADVKIHENPLFSDPLDFDRFTDEETGRRESTTGWFWVVDTEVDVLPDFDFGFVPKVWDKGKTHIWQKLNPITKKQYDYDGVKLCPKVSEAKGRPKYIREVSCIQHEYPKLYLKGHEDILEQILAFEAKTETTMYWLIDPYVKISEDFDFSYYPTQWDRKNVHVFSDQEFNHRGVRLIPTGLITNGEHTVKDIQTNSFVKLKKMPEVASERVVWPVIPVTSKKQFIKAMEKHRESGIDFVWSIDDDVNVNQDVIDQSFVPELSNAHSVHLWQKINRDKVHSYGGLRLWPTHRDYSDLTTDSLTTNKIKNIQYVKSPGSEIIPYDIVFISYKERFADQTYKHLRKRFDALRVQNVTGIFNAHKQAAQKARTKMFWVVDADAMIDENFNFDYVPDVYDQKTVHVWNSVNPVTGSEYGYGGVKLFNTEQVREATSWGLDFTTGLSTDFKAMPEISCTTRFNTDAFSTWRSAFRECVKLTLKDDADSEQRLNAWLNPLSDAAFSQDAKQGAEMGMQYALDNQDNIAGLDKINDFVWLGQYYKEVVGNTVK